MTTQAHSADKNLANMKVEAINEFDLTFGYPLTNWHSCTFTGLGTAERTNGTGNWIWKSPMNAARKSSIFRK